MGQKVHPVGLRLGITKSCDSQWIPDETHHYPQLIKEDKWIRSLIKKRFPKAKISKIYITRQEYKTEIKIAAAYPKYVIKSELHTSLLKKDLYYPIKSISTERIADPLINAEFIANSIAETLQARGSFRFAMKQAIKKTKTKTAKQKIKGIKIQISGRLNGAEMARTEWVRSGQVPLHTLKENIDYCAYPAQTRYGILGIKIWICNR